MLRYSDLQDAARRRALRLMVRVSANLANRHVSASWRKWMYHTRHATRRATELETRRESTRRTMRRAVLKMEYARQSSALAKWITYSRYVASMEAEHRRARRTMRRAVIRMECARQSRAWTQWTKASAAIAEEHAVQKRRIERFASRWLFRGQSQAWRQWTLYVQDLVAQEEAQQRAVAVLGRAVRRIRQGAIARAFRKLHDVVKHAALSELQHKMNGQLLRRTIGRMAHGALSQAVRS